MSNHLGDANKMTKLTGHLVEAQPFTKEKPTVPGWYRLRQKRKVQIVHIVQFVGLKHLTVLAMTRGYGSKLSMIHGEWSGPIPAPTDAPAQAYYKAEEVQALVKSRMQELMDDYETEYAGQRIDELKRLLGRLRGGA